MSDRFEYEVRVVFGLPEAELDYLVRLSGAHYDLTCRSAGRPGPGGFLHGMRNAVSDGMAPGRLTARQLGLVCKILEQPGSRDDLRSLFHRLLAEVSGESARVNGLSP